MSIQAEVIKIDQDKARELYRDYKKHQHYSTPIDHEIQRVYKLIAQGRMVIKALASVVAAGLNDEGLPKLAIVRADARICHLRFTGRDKTGATFSMDVGWPDARNVRRNIILPEGSFPAPTKERRHFTWESIVPLIPIHLRPKRGLENYHILYEAEWFKKIPVDPYLLRRIGGDLWLVVAAWDLSEVERAVLESRVNS